MQQHYPNQPWNVLKDRKAGLSIDKSVPIGRWILVAAVNIITVGFCAYTMHAMQSMIGVTQHPETTIHQLQ